MHKAHTRSAIEESSLRLFAERGFDDTTVEELAEAAGVARRTFFRYFPSKNDVIFGSYEEHLDMLRAEMSAVPPGTTAVEAVHRGFRAANDYRPEELPTLAIRIRLMLEVPSLRAHAAWRYTGYERVVADAVTAHLGEPPGPPGPPSPSAPPSSSAPPGLPAPPSPSAPPGLPAPHGPSGASAPPSPPGASASPDASVPSGPSVPSGTPGLYATALARASIGVMWAAYAHWLAQGAGPGLAAVIDDAFTLLTTGFPDPPRPAHAGLASPGHAVRAAPRHTESGSPRHTESASRGHPPGPASPGEGGSAMPGQAAGVRDEAGG